MKCRTKALITISILALLTLSGCADTVTPDQIESINPVGFWYGLWHGIIIPYAWIVSLFNEGTAIYATYNNGGWYDFGFVIGIGPIIKVSYRVTTSNHHNIYA